MVHLQRQAWRIYVRFTTTALPRVYIKWVLEI
jgi:hypothetical protein